jgi:agmatinase
VGFDVVEVAPVYDGPGQQTALLAASIAYELLALRAVATRRPRAE